MSMTISVPLLKTAQRGKKKKKKKNIRRCQSRLSVRNASHKCNTIYAADRLCRSNEFNRKTSMFRPKPRATSTRTTATSSHESHPFPAIRVSRASRTPWYDCRVRYPHHDVLPPFVVRGQHVFHVVPPLPVDQRDGGTFSRMRNSVI